MLGGAGGRKEPAQDRAEGKPALTEVKRRLRGFIVPIGILAVGVRCRREDSCRDYWPCLWGPDSVSPEVVRPKVLLWVCAWQVYDQYVK